jgi:hypothetical protein
MVQIVRWFTAGIYGCSNLQNSSDLHPPIMTNIFAIDPKAILEHSLKSHMCHSILASSGIPRSWIMNHKYS